METIRRFVVFEGIDGSGTSTQLARLGERLSREGVAHWTTAEPTPGPVGRLIREALSGSSPLHPDTVARLFAADRGEHLFGADGILARTGRGELVVSDRFVLSSLAYQGLTCGPDLPVALNGGFPRPELLLFFDIDPETSMGRVAARPDREIYETLAFQRKVAEAYRSLVASWEGGPARVARIDAARSPDEVEEAVWEAVRPIAGRA